MNAVKHAVAIMFVLASVAAWAVELPAGYTRLDWIESDDAARQWIDSEYHPKATTIIRASILARAKRADWTEFFGVMSNDSPTNSVVFRYYSDQRFNAIFCNADYTETVVAATANGEYDIELKNGSLTVSGTDSGTKGITTVYEPVDAPIYIFCENRYSSASHFSSAQRFQPMRLYSMKIYEVEDSVEVPKRDFVPCIDDNGACGLWDSVEGKFYGNKASGADFTGGVFYRVAANETLQVPSVSGTAELRGADAATSEVEVASVAPGSQIIVANTLKGAAVDSVGAGVNVLVRKVPGSDAPVALSLPAGQLVDSLTIEEGVTVYLASGSVGSFEGNGKVVVQGAVKYGTIADGIAVKIEAGASLASVLSEVLPSALGDLPALWLDASRADTQQEYTYNGHTVPEGTFPGIVVRKWSDCRAGATGFAVNARSSTGNSDGGFIRTMPYTITNALNGLTVMSFGTFQVNVSGAKDEINTNGQGSGGGHSEQRRLIFDKPIAHTLAIMVYGSQDSGGVGLIGGWTNGDEHKHPLQGETISSARSDTYYNRTNPPSVENVLLRRANVPAWVDGEEVDSDGVAALNGGWQIITLGVAPGDSPQLRSLGMADQNANAGGQRYAEVLIFTNELTTVQRKAVEFYLAKKWGLTAGYNAGGRPKSLEIADGASFETVDSEIVLPACRGSIAVGGALEANGVAVGSVTVAAGASLTIPSGKLSTGEQIDAREDLVARLDPDCEDDVGFNNNRNMVHALFGHGKKDTDGTPYIQAYYNDANNDRRPTYSRAARGFGPVRGWMDLYADPANLTVKGNNLRFKTNHAQEHWKGNKTESFPQNVQTAFIVMDSCYGGGLPVIDSIKPDGNSLVKARSSYNDYKAPIWGNGTSTILTGGETRINGRQVNGTTTGFTGAPELFSFTTDGRDFPARVFGYYDAGPEKSYEVLGEIVLFKTVLDNETRGGIEAYLMKKWLGILPPGYADWTGATVSGAGTVVAADPAALPQFDPSFSGAVSLTGQAFEFVLNGADKTVANAISTPGTLQLADEGTISLSFTGTVKSGVYTLATFDSLAGNGLEGWTLPTSCGELPCRIWAESNRIVARVGTCGLSIYVR